MPKTRCRRARKNGFSSTSRPLPRPHPTRVGKKGLAHLHRHTTAGAGGTALHLGYQAKGKLPRPESKHRVPGEARALSALCLHGAATHYRHFDHGRQWLWVNRIVTLSENALNTALAAGIQSVGTVATRGSNTVSQYLHERAGKPSIVGTAREYNLEAILALQPDLILASQVLSDDVYAKLSLCASKRSFDGRTNHKVVPCLI